jgi:hypothetical protein
MFTENPNHDPSPEPPGTERPPTVAELAAAVGKHPRTLARNFADGCPRDSADAIKQWRADNIEALDAPNECDQRPRYCFHPLIPPRAVAEDMGRFLLEDSRLPLFKGINRKQLRAIIANQVIELSNMVDMSGTLFDRHELLADLGLSDVAPNIYGTQTSKTNAKAAATP